MLALSTLPTRNDASDADVLVEVGPVDAFPIGDQLPVASLGWRPVRQTWIPPERYGDPSPINEVDAQPLAGYFEACCKRFALKYQSSHATP